MNNPITKPNTAGITEMRLTAINKIPKNISGNATKIKRNGIPQRISRGSITATILGKEAKNNAVKIAITIPLFIFLIIFCFFGEISAENASMVSCLLSILVIIPAKHAKINAMPVMQKKIIGKETNTPTRRRTIALMIFFIQLHYNYLRIGASIF